MIITCPHCHTRYQVTHEAIGSAGRKVQCAHCHEAWQERPHLPAEPPPEPPPLAPADEDALDAGFVAEEHALAARVSAKLAGEVAARAPAGPPVPGPPDPVRSGEAAAPPPANDADSRRRLRAFNKRRLMTGRDLPMSRMRSFARIAIWTVLVLALLAGYLLRAPIVAHAPALAGLYAAIGLPVNVVGLDFSGVTTRRLVRDARDFLLVTMEVRGVAAERVAVPPVLVTLTDLSGAPVYQWTVVPQAVTLAAGERVTLETQLSGPPPEAVGVRLSFVGGRSADAGGTVPVSVPRIQGAN